MTLDSNVNPDTEALKGYLNLQLPVDSSQGPAVFEFERFRELKVDWHFYYFRGIFV